MITLKKLKSFASSNGWIILEQSTTPDGQIGDRYILFLTPYGRIVKAVLTKLGRLEGIVAF